MNLSAYSKAQRVKNAVVAGTSDQACTTVDMQDFEGVVFVAALGTLTAGQATSLKAGQGAASNGSDAVDITGAATAAMADGDSNKLLVLDVYRPTSRFVTATLKRATQNAVIDGVIAIQYGAKKEPTVQDATTVSASKTIVST